MDTSQFESELKADGYQDVERQDLAERPGKGKHRHLFDIRGFVTSGTFVVAETDHPVIYGAGQVFDVARGTLHDEWVGPGGASVIIGRRHPADTDQAIAKQSALGAPPAENRKRRARDLASKAIDTMTDGDMSADVKATRKRKLIKGPEEFLDVRVDRSEKE